MNCLDTKTRAQIIGCLIEGCSIRATVRMTGAAKNTVVKLLADIGCACAAYHDRYVRDLRVRRLQCDEIWQFVGSKAKNVSIEKKQEGWGDIWTWIGIDADTKLVVSYLVGGRDGGWAMEFMQDCADRIRGRVQVTTDGHRAYLDAVEDAFRAGCGLCAATEDLRRSDGRRNTALLSGPLHRLRHEGCERKSRPEARQHIIRGTPESNAANEQRRFTRLTNAFSKKVDNHRHSVALHYMYYNFCRVHQTLRVTPAMEAGIERSRLES